MQIINDRRALHRIPELELQLPKTMEYILTALQPLNCRILTPVGCAVCAFFDFGKDSAIAFRADMDGLPVTEETGRDFASRIPGQMHACGHDGHMAILLELARRLSAKNALAHNVLLIFQPGEENPGGADAICRTGILQKFQVEAIFGLHLWPGLEAGKIFCRENEMMSHANELDVHFYGRAAHIAKYGEGIDTILAAGEFIRQVYAAEAQLPKNIYRLLKFGRMESGTVRNVVAAHTHLQGCFRVFQDEIYDMLLGKLREAKEAVEKQFGCRVELCLNDCYPAVMNPPQLYQKVAALVPLSDPGAPSMTAEDFSYYQQQVPGLFFWLGLGDVPPLHSNTFDFDESILVKGADFFEELAEKFQ